MNLTASYTIREASEYGIDAEVRFEENKGEIFAKVNSKKYIIPEKALNNFMDGKQKEMENFMKTGKGSTDISIDLTGFMFSELKKLMK